MLYVRIERARKAKASFRTPQRLRRRTHLQLREFWTQAIEKPKVLPMSPDHTHTVSCFPS
jgi:hypothetical protein